MAKGREGNDRRQRIVARAAFAVALLSGCRSGSSQGTEAASAGAPGPPAAAEAAPTSTSAPPSVALGEGAAMSCVESYDMETLAARSFAFDGSVASIGETGPAEGDPYVEVVFDVREWFVPAPGRAAPPASLTVEMLPPGILTSVGNAEYSLGSRLLVSGEPRWGGAPLDAPVVWPCGFSRTHDDATASAWRDAFQRT